MAIHIGDRVRVLKGQEEGIVVGFGKGNLIEIEIEEDFVIPVPANEVVVINKAEQQYFEKEVPEKEIIPKSGAIQGIYFAMVPGSQNLLTWWLINNSDYHLPYTVEEKLRNEVVGVSKGHIEPYRGEKIATRKINELNQWGVLLFKFLPFTSRAKEELVPVAFTQRFTAKKLDRPQTEIPLVDAQGYLFRLDETRAQTINPEVLMSSMLEKQGGPAVGERPKHKGASKSLSVDLHIEQLDTRGKDLAKEEILNFQLKTFEKRLDLAIQNGYDEITFIHGVGNGILRQEIQRRLGLHPHVAYFEDAQKEKFGYGATLVRIK